jgi:hypothetical protein
MAEVLHSGEVTLSSAASVIPPSLVRDAMVEDVVEAQLPPVLSSLAHTA